jgi:hypothetical protein
MNATAQLANAAARFRAGLFDRSPSFAAVGNLKVAHYLNVGKLIAFAEDF